MPNFTQEVEVLTDVDVEITVKEFYHSMSEGDEIEMKRLIESDTYARSKDYYLADMIAHKTDIQILTDEEFLKKLCYLLKYECSDLLEIVKEELK